MASSQSSPNVEMEAAKFLHKLIQDSKDEPTKLATKLYVILQHMKSSGKENSMPYQVISRAMETVINQNGIDIEALKSSRLPLTGRTPTGDSTTTQYAGKYDFMKTLIYTSESFYILLCSTWYYSLQNGNSTLQDHHRQVEELQKILNRQWQKMTYPKLIHLLLAEQLLA
uniref:Uncharacterized protein n=1 Tax=Rhizophora mucronata TaxID=61149 RepID=A0A2P2ME61_RHIMU